MQEAEFLIFLIDRRKANNKYLKSYDPKQKLKPIIYLDANNLYGYAMSKFVSTRDKRIARITK